MLLVYLSAHLALVIAKEYGAFHSVLKAMNTVLMLFGYALLYASLYSWNQKDIPGVQEAFPAWAFAMLGAFGVCVVVASIWGFVAIYKEWHSAVLAHCIWLFVIMVLIVGFSSYAAKGTESLGDKFKEECSAVLSYLNEE